MLQKKLMVVALMLAFSPALIAQKAWAQDPVGVSATEIKVGSTFPFSGPASMLGNVGKSLMGYVNYINDRGGLNGRKINLIALDDAYSPPKSVEQNRKLVESDEVAFLYSPLGTASISSVLKYVNDRKVPHLFVVSGATKFTNGAVFPYTTTGIASFNSEGTAYAKFITQKMPGARIAILYQNDDMGKDLVTAFRSHMKGDFDKLVTARSYETTDPTVDGLIVTLKSTGAEAIFLGGTPKFTAQALKKMHELGWKPLTVVNIASSSIASTFAPVGLENVKGVLTSTFMKDPSDPNWANDPGMNRYKEFLAKYLPGGDIAEATYVLGHVQGELLEHVLKQCGNDLSRENIMKQALNVKNFTPSLALPGISVNTSPENHQAWTALQFQEFNGKNWAATGKVINVAD